MKEMNEDSEKAHLNEEDININKSNIELSKNIPIMNKNMPSIQNLNTLILSCVKNDEYCSSFLDYLKKMIHIRQIDYYLTYTNILYCFKPKEINETAKIRKHLKNKYARDDPGFLIILILNLFVSSLCYSLTFGHMNIFFILNIFFIQAFILLFTSGVFIALFCKIIIDKYFRNNEIGNGKEHKIEYVYAFDIHCNSFVPMYFFTSIVPFCILPLVNGSKGFIRILISNTLIFIGISYYLYVTFMSYFSLPFVKKNKMITLIIWPIILLYLILTLSRVNVYNYFIVQLFK